MIELKPDLEPTKEISPDIVPISFHPSFYPVHDRLKKWIARFSQSVDNSVFSDFFLFFLLASKKFLDHRSPAHLFRLGLSIHLMQKKLLHAATFFPHVRDLEIRWIPTSLLYPFSSKPVLGCIIGFNVMDRYELFDEENILLALQKYLPELKLVKESSYCHNSQHKNLKIFYLEIEKKDNSLFSFEEHRILKRKLEEKVKNSIQTLSPTIFMGLNEEEIYKNILVLSQEIRTLQDLPQAYITLDQQTGKEIVFRVTLVHITPFHRFSLKECFFDCSFVSERILTVRHLENHPIEAHIFRLHLPREAALLRSDGSLDFYSARQKVATLLRSAVGEFRDYNGGIIIKQQELLEGFKRSFQDISNGDPELIEAFFYALTPLEKQVLLNQDTLSTLFSFFLENRKQKLPKGVSYAFKTYHNDNQIFLILHGDNASLNEPLSHVLQEQSFVIQDIAYNTIDTAEGFFFNCVFLQADAKSAESFIHDLRQSLEHWHKKIKDRQILKVGFEYTIVSLDPRIGGETVSGDMLTMLFEGLSRFNQSGTIENAIAESIEVTGNSKQYIFKLRPSFWNDGSPVSAHDFEYAWKKVLSPDFKTSFAYLFYPIKNAQDAKEGKVPIDEVGVQAIDDRTLKVELMRPTPYFLQLTAHPIYSPVHRFIDQEHPEWPNDCEKNYPCNGPFQLKINRPSQGYQLIKNPFYWDTNRVGLDQIILTQMSPAQALTAFQNKEIDWIGNPFGGWHPSYNGSQEGKVVSFPNSWVCWLAFNTSHPAFRNHKLRQAFSYAIQRADILAKAHMPLNPAFSLLLPHYRANGRPLYSDYDPQKAREIFKEALAELQFMKDELTSFSLIYHENGVREYTAHCLKQQFKECLGIEIELKPQPWNAVFSKMTQGNFQMGLVHWTSCIDDPIYTLNAFKSGKQEINFAKWEHPDFLRLIDLSEQEVNPFQRSYYLLKAEELLCQEIPVVPLFYQPYQALVRKDLQVIFKSPCGLFNIARSYFKK